MQEDDVSASPLGLGYVLEVDDFRARPHALETKKERYEPPALLWDIMMPTILRIGPYRLYFYSHDCGEPRHSHVDRERMSVKFWLDPDVSLARNVGFSRQELRRIERMIREHLEVLRDEWDSFCG
jgi:hypothetical protein